jgi:opacity protein-like surface antigen
MKNTFMLLGCMFMVLLSSSIFFFFFLYVSANIGPGILNDSDLEETSEGITTTATIEFEAGLTYGVAIGYDFSRGRVEFAVDYKSHELSRLTDVTETGVGDRGNIDADGDIYALSSLVNGFYDIHLNAPVTPYIMGGAGIAKITVKKSGDKEADSVFAYQLGAGIGYDIDDDSILDLGYRFFTTSDPEFDKAEAEYYSHGIVIGLRLYFD